VTRPIEALDWFAGLEPAADPDGTALRTGMQTAGAGAIVIWLAAKPVPAQVASVARAVGAGSVSAAHALAGATR
jgi:hypothetical protein